MRIFFTFFLISSTFSSFVFSSEIDLQWQHLGHWKKTISGGWRSEADGLDFFIAPDGKANPEAELKATVAAFHDRDLHGRKVHPQCQFPARLKYLKKQSDLHDIPSISCADFSNFKERLAAKSITLVFSSYFLNNPASAFGHTLLRLNKESRDQKKENSLLDYGVNYAANPTTQNALAYALLGVIGGFTGTFASMPYYLKVREYADYESRDLWEYDLNLIEDEVDTLVAHLWELGSTYFDYYYFTENCSYHILRAIEAAAPQYDFSNRMSWIVIPSDTVKVVTSYRGLIHNIHFRPSSRSIFVARYNQLSATEKSMALDLAQKNEIELSLNDLNKNEKAKVLDSAIDYIDYKHSKEIIEASLKKETNWYTERKQSLLSARSKVDVITTDLKIEKPEREMPHSGHKSRRFTVFAGSSNAFGNEIGLGMRFALHDFSDPIPGYPEYSKIIFFGGFARYNTARQSVWMEDISLFHVESLTPFTAYDHTPSWKARIGADTIRDQGCTNCKAAILHTGAGFTFRPNARSPLIAEVTADIGGQFSKAFESFARVSAGPQVLFRYLFSKNLILTAWANRPYFFFTKNHQGFEQTAEIRKSLLKDLAAGAKASHFPTSFEYTGQLFVYF